MKVLISGVKANISDDYISIGIDMQRYTVDSKRVQYNSTTNNLLSAYDYQLSLVQAVPDGRYPVVSETLADTLHPLPIENDCANPRFTWELSALTCQYTLATHGIHTSNCIDSNSYWIGYCNTDSTLKYTLPRTCNSFFDVIVVDNRGAK